MMPTWHIGSTKSYPWGPQLSISSDTLFLVLRRTWGKNTSSKHGLKYSFGLSTGHEGVLGESIWDFSLSLCWPWEGFGFRLHFYRRRKRLYLWLPYFSYLTQYACSPTKRCTFSEEIVEEKYRLIDIVYTISWVGRKIFSKFRDRLGNVSCIDTAALAIKGHGTENV